LTAAQRLAELVMRVQEVFLLFILERTIEGDIFLTNLIYSPDKINSMQNKEETPYS